MVQSSLPGITYNSQRFSGAAVPCSLEDVLKPEYKGYVGATPYAAWFDHLAAPELWGLQRTTEYVARLADQASGLMRCNEEDRLLNGEFYPRLDCSQRGPLRLKARGAPMEFTVASDAPLIAPLYMAVPRNAAHPNAAKLWINYLLSREAQDVMLETSYVDSHLVPVRDRAADRGTPGRRRQVRPARRRVLSAERREGADPHPGRPAAHHPEAIVALPSLARTSQTRWAPAPGRASLCGRRAGVGVRRLAPHSPSRPCGISARAERLRRRTTRSHGTGPSSASRRLPAAAASRPRTARLAALRLHPTRRGMSQQTRV